MKAAGEIAYVQHRRNKHWLSHQPCDDLR